MIRFLPEDYGQADWDTLAARLEGGSLLQDWAWAAAKAQTSSWRVERGILDDGGRVLGAVQVMVRSLPVLGGGLAWVARGPLYALGEAIYYPALVAALHRHYVGERHLHLRIAPAVSAKNTDAGAFVAAGFRPSGACGWVSAAVDLAPSEAALRRGLAQKWRNALNKAEKLGVSVEKVSSEEKFDDCLVEYRTFLGERRFVTSVTPELLAALQRLLPPERKIRAWRCTGPDGPLGTALIARHGDRSEYLVGMLTDAGRRCSAGHILLWRAMVAEKEAGARWFDVGGMDPLLTPPGVLKFKAGLGGAPYRLAEEIEADDAGFRARIVRWRVARARRGAGAAA